MKTIHILKADLYFQCLLACLNAYLLLTALRANNGFVLVILFQAFINIYHFFTNLIHIGESNKAWYYLRYRYYYMYLTIFYLPVGFLFTLANLNDENMFYKIWLIIPQIVLHLYILLCKRELDQKVKNGILK